MVLKMLNNQARTDYFKFTLPVVPRYITVVPRYNTPRYNADLAITRFFITKVFLPHILNKGKFSAKLVNTKLIFFVLQ